MTESVMDAVKRRMDEESRSDAISRLPADFYATVSAHAQKLGRSRQTGNSELANNLISRQLDLIGSLSRRILQVRLDKAVRQGALTQLLPEERYVCSTLMSFQARRDWLSRSVSSGQPSAVEFARSKELAREVTVRFTRHVNELVGLDLKHYGPFEPDDLASIPCLSAGLLVASGDAVEIYTRDDH